MPVAVGETHEFGEDLYMVRTPSTNFGERRLGVRFTEGVGFTKSEAKARRFMDEFGYTIVLPPGENPARWGSAVRYGSDRYGEDYQEDGPVYVHDEIDEDEDGAGDEE